MSDAKRHVRNIIRCLDEYLMARDMQHPSMFTAREFLELALEMALEERVSADQKGEQQERKA